MNSLTLADIPRYDDETIELADGLSLHVKTEVDQDQGAPWEECDGHGPVSEWTSRDKAPGELVLCSDGRKKRYYDFAEAIKLAKRDGWDAPPYKTGTKGETAVRAVESDFKFLQEWCNDDWQYVGVIVTLKDADGAELGQDSLWGVESRGQYWRECALEMANALIDGHAKETSERTYWEARDVLTE